MWTSFKKDYSTVSLLQTSMSYFVYLAVFNKAVGRFVFACCLVTISEAIERLHGIGVW